MKACKSSELLRSATVDLYGWESEGRFWHGPTELRAGARRSLEALNPDCALCLWKTNSHSPDGLPLRMMTTVRDLGDCAIATIDVDRSCPGPVSIVAAVPAHRQPLLRPEFAFELTAFAHFLGGPHANGAELAIHDHIDHVLASGGRSIVFALCTTACCEDVSIPLSRHIEQVATGLIEWLSLRDGSGRESTRRRPRTLAAAGA